MSQNYKQNAFCKFPSQTGDLAKQLTPEEKTKKQNDPAFTSNLFLGEKKDYRKESSF
ncbi:hypothetical protein Y015_01645 [Chlamydia muridarum str. Nigg CM972]|nr:hypothetical protein TAC_01645 [Chlamydia muridarum str. Nigg3 CMUT3-5]AHH24242.1 hypothetical protein Y015_01645 [Chlamydia muridarum str. Nigg CM972]